MTALHAARLCRRPGPRSNRRPGRQVMSTNETGRPQQHWWYVVIAAAALLMITMGARQSLGLFVSPLNTSTGLGIVTVSFALAVGQFVWGAAQPVFGALMDRAGTVRVIVIGALMMAVGLAAT